MGKLTSKGVKPVAKTTSANKVSGIAEVAELYAATAGVSATAAKKVVQDVVECISTKIVEGGVSFKGVMTIKPKVRKGRSGKIAFGENKGQEWKSEDKVVLEIKTGSTMEAELNK